MYNELHKLDELSRRKFLQYSAKALLGVGLCSVGHKPAWAADVNPNARTKNVIYVFLQGGMSQIDTFDLKPDWKQQGPVKAIASNVGGIQLSHQLPNLARHMDKIAVIRSMQSHQGAHGPGQYFLHTSYENRGSIQHPGLGAWLMQMSGETNSTLPGNMRIGGSSNTPGRAGFLNSKYNPLHLGNSEMGIPHSQAHHSVDAHEIQKRLELVQLLDLTFHRHYSSSSLAAHAEVYEQAAKIMGSEDLKAFDLSQESPQTRALYGTSEFSKSCLLARRLVEQGVRFVELTLGGWDTHVENHNRLESLNKTLDESIAGLLEDLHQRGLLGETMVVIGTEFGRGPKMNVNGGRDHQPQAFTCLLAGGGIRGGQVYGATDERSAQVTENPVTIPDFNATIAHGLGLPLEKIIYSPSGRPFQVANKGRPVTALFG
jgi:uncharacterized protein (DUF1501 family)